MAICWYTVNGGSSSAGKEFNIVKNTQGGISNKTVSGWL